MCCPILAIFVICLNDTPIANIRSIFLSHIINIVAYAASSSIDNKRESI
uniref:Uncharacterized protein n=1 Tax=Phage sp. ctXnn1 TaxID=2826749 RepID=A0A8S5NAJ4_9VIRU|nr:MAG TPA: hypothetical protein [Phage sp. ctXnn1]